MIKTAEYVSLGHPDKIADYITSYILDRFIEQDEHTRYAVEVMLKGNTVVLGGEISSTFCPTSYDDYVKAALRNIGYDEKYAKCWGEKAIDINKIQIINLIGCQSSEIAQGIINDGWGDQGVFVGYACQGPEHINRELYLARRLNNALYQKALHSNNLGLDIKTQITIDNEQIITAIVAIPMLQSQDLSADIINLLGQKPQHLIINGTGLYSTHSSVADCGITGRKLACDFYSTACPIGGGSPWSKDASKADLSLNLYARRLAVENLADNDEVWIYLSSCIGRSQLPSAIIRKRKDKLIQTSNLQIDTRPSAVIHRLGLNKPIYAELCRRGLIY